MDLAGSLANLQHAKLSFNPSISAKLLSTLNKYLAATATTWTSVTANLALTASGGIIKPTISAEKLKELMMF
jgi:hypothetical protein